MWNSFYNPLLIINVDQTFALNFQLKTGFSTLVFGISMAFRKNNQR